MAGSQRGRRVERVKASEGVPAMNYIVRLAMAGALALTATWRRDSWSCWRRCPGAAICSRMEQSGAPTIVDIADNIP